MKIKPLKTWAGPINACDICGCQPFNTFVDGKTKAGPWAIMCADCYIDHGTRLGEGWGQIYKLEQIGKEKFWIDRTPK